MKLIHILYSFKEGPWGGGNQFLKALREYLRQENCYAESLGDADIALVNSHHWIENKGYKQLAKLRAQGLSVICRLDGSISIGRRDPGQKFYDDIIIYFINKFCDGVIYQNKYCQDIFESLGARRDLAKQNILNAPDPSIFIRRNSHALKGRLKLLATCWAPNLRKGFDHYKWLDEHLDFSQYQLTFVGNSPIEFSNIKLIPPLSSTDLAAEIAKHDIYIQAAEDEPCSNALIEAMHIGLPAIARASGGNPAIVQDQQLLYSEAVEIIDILARIRSNYLSYTNKIKLPDLGEVGSSYRNFMLKTAEGRRSTAIELKKLRGLEALLLKHKLIEKGLGLSPRKYLRKLKKIVKGLLG